MPLFTHARSGPLFSAPLSLPTLPAGNASKALDWLKQGVQAGAEPRRELQQMQERVQAERSKEGGVQPLPRAGYKIARKQQLPLKEQ